MRRGVSNVGLMNGNLRRHVVWCSTKSVRGPVKVGLKLAHAKVCYPDVAFVVQK